MKLFRLTKQFVPDYGQSGITQEFFYATLSEDNIDKVRTFINYQHNIALDSNGKYCRYIPCDEGGDYYTLEELEITLTLD